MFLNSTLLPSLVILHGFQSRRRWPGAHLEINVLTHAGRWALKRTFFGFSLQMLRWGVFIPEGDLKKKKSSLSEEERFHFPFCVMLCTCQHTVTTWCLLGRRRLIDWANISFYSGSDVDRHQSIVHLCLIPVDDVDTIKRGTILFTYFSWVFFITSWSAHAFKF